MDRLQRRQSGLTLPADNIETTCGCYDSRSGFSCVICCALKPRPLPFRLCASLLHCASTDAVVPVDPPIVKPVKPSESACRTGQLASLGEAFFEDISDQSGIRAENYVVLPPKAIPINDYRRLGFADINGDGYDDIVMHNLFPNPQKGIPFEHLVFLNNKDGTFRNFRKRESASSSH